MESGKQQLMAPVIGLPMAPRQKSGMEKPMMQKRGAQRGVSLVGLMFVLAVLGALVLLALKIIPTYVEFRAISTAIVSAKAGGGTVRDMRSAFDRSASATYIDSIGGRDLNIANEDGEIEISFAYEKKIPLAGPVSLVLDYAGTTAKVGAAKPAESTTR
jgi:hypothetical protein